MWSVQIPGVILIPLLLSPLICNSLAGPVGFTYRCILNSSVFHHFHCYYLKFISSFPQPIAIAPKWSPCFHFCTPLGSVIFMMTRVSLWWVKLHISLAWDSLMASAAHTLNSLKCMVSYFLVWPGFIFEIFHTISSLCSTCTHSRFISTY